MDVLAGGFQPQTAEIIREYWEDLGIHMVFRVAGGNLYWTRFSANAMDLLCTPDDVASDVMVLNEVAYGVAYWGPLWYKYLNTDGRIGLKPPPAVMELLDLWQRMRQTDDEQLRIELGRRLVRSQPRTSGASGPSDVSFGPSSSAAACTTCPRTASGATRGSRRFCTTPSSFYIRETN